MDEESEGESGSEDESDLGSTNTNSDVRLPLKVARVQDDSQSCEEVSQHKSPSKKAKAKSTKRKKKTRGSSRFLERWKQIPEFKTWLQSRHNPSRNIKSQRLLQYVSSGEDKKVVLATIRLNLLIAEKNLSFTLIDWLIPTLKEFPDRLILEKVMMSRTKCGSVMRFGIGSYLISTLVETLNSTPWSLFIDETTDVPNGRSGNGRADDGREHSRFLT
ncbi:hypothetical protein OUZ56_003465 [Daphnia magna]|uniref:Uncharacterized protein n=1 Tax=Daphnia magna TaxID=35525 RepID=A0ABR0A8T6_9CRUS|nr:hypothetical protein OUZ56_003465 [Daphnia magna]